MTKLIVRQAAESDAEGFLDLWDTLDAETEFMLFEPNERQATLSTQKSRLISSVDSENVRIFVLEDTDEKRIAGFCAGRRGNNIRDKHTIHVVIGLRNMYTGNNWGHKLLMELEQWAQSLTVSRLELSVMVNNRYAISLYRKLGYEIEGTKKCSIRLRNGFIDEYLMAKLI